MAFFIPALIAGMGALGGALGNRAQTQQQNTTQTTNSSSSSNPNYGETELSVRDNILRQLLGATEDTSNFMTGAVNAGVQNINNSDAIRKRMLGSMLTSRGLGRTTSGVNTMAGGDQNRQNQIVNLMAQAPFQQEELRRNRVNDLSRFFSTLPVGVTNTGTSTSTGNSMQTTPGNMAAGALQSGGSLAALLYGMGAFKGN
jgi:hypothetical protein